MRLRARVVLQVPRALLPLARGLPGPERLVAEEAGLQEAGRFCQIADLPSVIGLSDGAIPAAVPYLRPDPARRAAWRDRLDRLPGLRVGIAWQGNRKLTWDFARSIPAARLAPLAGQQGVSFVALQLDETAPDWMEDISGGLADFGETAAAMEWLDLVIGVDSAIVHLAGALGRPVWLLNRFNSDYRWRVDRADSDWYPSLRSFRQPRLGDWDAVVEEVRAALAACVQPGDFAERLAEAAQAHQSGDLAAAERGYLRILAQAPAEPDALHLLALSLLQRGETAAALARAEQAIRHAPHRADYLDTRANALRSLGRIEQAVADWRVCLGADAEQPQAWFNLGAALADANRFEEAAICQREALGRDPALLPAQTALANTLVKLGRPAEAEAPLRAARRLTPEDTGVLNNLGLVLRDLGRMDEALVTFAELVRLAPRWGEAWAVLAQCALAVGRSQEVALAQSAIGPAAQDARVLHAIGLAWVHAGRFAEAEAAFAAAMRADPEFGEAQRMRALVLGRLGRPEEAEAAMAAAERRMRTAVEQSPKRADLKFALAAILFDLGRPAEAVALLDRTLALDPASAEARHLRAECLIAAGRDADGWAERDARLSTPGRRRTHPAPQWDGAAAPDKVLLLTNERDGFGDFLMFCRFVPRAAEQARVVLQVAPDLLWLARSLAGPERVVSTDEGLLPADLHCPVPSLPTVLRVTAESIPAEFPYLRPDAERVAAWRGRLAELPGLRVGIAWQGSRSLNSDFLRSIPAEELARLANTPRISFVSLQRGESAPAWMFDPSAELVDFAETAALTAALDLVVCVDTAVQANCLNSPHTGSGRTWCARPWCGSA
jgi:tetratricopeptide (TPR) repeat protein